MEVVTVSARAAESVANDKITERKTGHSSHLIPQLWMSALGRPVCELAMADVQAAAS